MLLSAAVLTPPPVASSTGRRPARQIVAVALVTQRTVVRQRAGTLTQGLSCAPLLARRQVRRAGSWTVLAAAAADADAATKPPSGFRAQPIILSGIAAWLALGLDSSVGARDITFALAFSLYIYCINRWRFANNASAVVKNPGPLLLGPMPSWFKSYILSFASITVLLPLLTIIAAPLVLSGHSLVALRRSIAPPLFLLLAQLVMESITSSGGASSASSWAAIPRILTPVGFNAFRLISLFEWAAAAAAAASAAGGTPAGTQAFAMWALALAVVNLGMWIYNLFGFLLLRMLPAYLAPDFAR